MNTDSLAPLRLSLAVLVTCAGLGGLGACGSSSPSATGGAGTSGGAGTGAAAGNGGAGTGAGTAGTTSDLDASTAMGSCPKSAFKILFNPMYSAYDGMHTFQLPAVVNDIDPTAVTIEWSASDPSMVALEPDATTGGVMITMQKSGTVSIIASAGGLCGSSLLTITDATTADWTAGSDRYNDGVDLTRVPIGRGPGMARDASAAADGAATDQAACTNCHGDNATDLTFKTVQHTPEQTGGFSDADLINIFEHGMVPAGGYFDTSIVPYNVWQTFHKWDPGDAEKGLVVYLRSLTPTDQTGTSNFGGMFDGGARGGRDGGGMREGGVGMREAGGGQ
jgi:hypothetical protein